MSEVFPIFNYGSPLVPEEPFFQPAKVQRSPNSIFSLQENAAVSNFPLGIPPSEFGKGHGIFSAKPPQDILAKIWKGLTQPLLQQVGEELYFQGEFPKASALYSQLLASDPKNKTLRQLRYESDLAWLNSRAPADGKKTDLKGMASEGILKEMVVDRASLIALEFQKQSAEFKTWLRESKNILSAPREGQEFFLSQLQSLGNYYLQLALLPQLAGKENAWIGTQLKNLAADVFNSLAGFSSESSLAEVQKRAAYYQGLSQLAKEDEEGARFHFSQISEIPEARQLLQALEERETRLNNLAVVAIWKNFFEEKSAVEGQQLESPLGMFYWVADRSIRGDGKTIDDDLAVSFNNEEQLIAAVQKKLLSGEALTIQNALGAISAEETGTLSQLAGERLAQSLPGSRPYGDSTDLVPRLIEYAANPKSKTYLERPLFDKASQLAASYGEGNTVTGVYLLLKERGRDPLVKENVQRILRHSTEAKGVVDYLGDVLKNSDSDTLALQVVLLAASAGLANGVTLGAMDKLQKLGMAGSKAWALAQGVNIATEGSALWFLNTAYQGLMQSPEEVFQSEALLNSYAATLLMIGGVKSLARVGGEAGNLLARRAGLTNLGIGTLSPLGNALAGLSRTAFGVGGMVLSTQASQGLDFMSTPAGGFEESLVHDVVGYFRFAVAHRLADRLSLGLLNRLGGAASSSALALRGAQLRVEGVMPKLQHLVAARSESGIPSFESKEGEAVYENLVSATALRPGFHPERLSALVQTGRVSEAETYGKDFGLQLNFEGQKLTEARELSLHERLAYQRESASISWFLPQGLAAKAPGVAGGLAAFFTTQVAGAATQMGLAKGESGLPQNLLGLGALLWGVGALASVLGREGPFSAGRERLKAEWETLEGRMQDPDPTLGARGWLEIIESLRGLDRRIFADKDPELLKRETELLSNGDYINGLSTHVLTEMSDSLTHMNGDNLRDWTNVFYILREVAISHYSRFTKNFATEKIKELISRLSTPEVTLLAAKLGEDPQYHGHPTWALLDTIATDHPNSHTRNFTKTKLEMLNRRAEIRAQIRR